jgi:aminoglycoside 3-N-acetyltransferase
MQGENGPEWVDIEEFDTTEPVTDALPADYFERIAADHIAAGAVRQGQIGEAASFLFEAQKLVPFAVERLEALANR